MLKNLGEDSESSVSRENFSFHFLRLYAMGCRRLAENDPIKDVRENKE